MAKKKVKKLAKHTPVPKPTAILDDGVDDRVDVIAAALSAAHSASPMLMKVCRLCETKDGPFLHIFDAEKVTAKKIEDLMPFGIAENDDLPHKICFRCSAKVEELHEFIQRCIKTQENLREAMGKKDPLTMKSKNRLLWEKQLHKTKLSNDDICDVLIKRAMEGIPLNAPLDDIAEEKPHIQTAPFKKPAQIVNESDSSVDSGSDEDDADISLKQVKMSIEKADEVTTRSSRSSAKALPEIEEKPEQIETVKKIKTYPIRKIAVEAKPAEPQNTKNAEVAENKKEPITEKVKEASQPKPTQNEKNDKPSKPFNIMDHVSTIKVNEVGVLYQCKLCNRNFLKKDIVMNHNCAKNHGPPKETSSANAPIPCPPKAPTVQYIKMDNIRKSTSLASLVDKTVEKAVEASSLAKPSAPSEPEAKPKPRIGPASRVKPRIGPASRVRPETPKDTPTPPTAPPTPEVSNLSPSLTFPVAPSLNSRYKLVPGPNNTFQLVEENAASDETPALKQPETQNRKRKVDTSNVSKPKHIKEPIEKSSSPEVIDLDDNHEPQKAEPYPVGLFQPVPHHSSVKPPVPFTTPAMKKQSYTIVQTGNPSKLLISTKPQPVEEPAKKKSKKKIEVKEKVPYNVTIEEAAKPANDAKRGFFTFVSLDSADILQPSYVLPSDNIIQESQITTSSSVKASAEKPAASNYSCNMCGESFSREKKLLTHIQSHYNQMDEEDEVRMGKPGPRRRTRKS